MPTNLPGTDVVVIGLGARRRSGGAAAGRAGLDVVGLEAGTLAHQQGLRPRRIRNNVRDWPMAVQKCNHEVPTHRLNARAPATRPPGHVDDERRQRHDPALLGAELAARALGLQGRERDGAALRRARVPAGSTIEDWPFGYELERPTTASNTRSACRARPATSSARSTGAATSSRRRARGLPDAAAAQQRLSRSHDRRGQGARLASVPRTGGHNSRALPGSPRRACTTASAIAAAATSTPRTVRTSRRFRARRIPGS